MPISLTSFTNFVFAAGLPKVEAVRRAKLQHNQGYDSKFDFYKRLREGVIQFERKQLPLNSLQEILPNLKDQKKKANFPAAIDGYIVWRGNHAYEWFKPSTGVWQIDQLAVNINPELGLKINGVPHLVKLYFNTNPLPARRAPIILHLMEKILRPKTGSAYAIGILDVRNSKFYASAGLNSEIEILLQAESQYWNTVWPLI